MEASAIDTNNDIRIWQQDWRKLECLDVFVSSLQLKPNLIPNRDDDAHLELAIFVVAPVSSSSIQTVCVTTQYR